MKFTITLLILVSSFFSNAQETSLNNYKYVIVDNQYAFQNESNEYRLNEFAVFELQKRNFIAFRNSDVLPEDLNRGACNALQLEIDESGSLSRYLILRLEDCTGSTVFTSKKGKGTTKSNDKAYFEALRDAMTSFDEIDYMYEKPEYVKVLQAPSGIDSVRTRNGQPGRSTTIAMETVEPAPAFDKKVIDNSIVNSPLESELVNDKVYRTKLKDYFILSTDSGFDVYKNKVLIGSLKKSKGGCYLALTSEFTGVGYHTSKGISVEYELFGNDQILEFLKE